MDSLSSLYGENVEFDRASGINVNNSENVEQVISKYI